MRYIQYKKPNLVVDNVSKVETGRMTISFRNGNPYNEGQIVSVLFKGKNTVGLVEKVNKQSLTVSMKGVDRKKTILYNNVIGIVG